MSDQFIVSLRKIRASDSAPGLFTGDAPAIIQWLKGRSNVSMYHIWVGSLNRYLPVSEFIQQYGTPNVRNCVRKYYTLDNKTEDILPNGRHLADGMVVMIEDPDCRERPEEVGKEVRGTDTDWLLNRVLLNNRWCTVSHAEIINGGETVQFVGIYEDGTKRSRSMGINKAWLVKIDTIRDSENQMTDRYNSVHNVVKDAFDKHGEYCCTICNGGEGEPSFESLVEETTKKVLGLL